MSVIRSTYFVFLQNHWIRATYVILINLKYFSDIVKEKKTKVWLNFLLQKLQIKKKPTCGLANTNENIIKSIF